MKQYYLKGIFLCLCLFTGINTFAYDAQIDGIYYNFSGNKATVTYKDNNYTSYSGNVVIPASVTYNSKTYSVTSIGDKAFRSCISLTSVTIPNSVTSIGNNAFSSCYSLTSITIPNSVTSIGGWAFYSCSDLRSVTIPNSVTSVGSSAFSHCSGLTSITIPNSVTSIGRSAFSDCIRLTSITIPNSVTSIENDVFAYCSSLSSISIPNSVTSIGSGAFEGCSGLTSITIPNSVTSIGSGAFEGCSGLTSITIPNSVTSIGKSAFRSCSSLASVTIPESVTSIGYDAFGNCTGLTSIIIPNSVTSIGYDAFSYCSGLTSITIPNSVTSIGDGAFNGCYFKSENFNNNSALSSDNNWGATFIDEERNDGLLIKDNVVIRCRPWATSVAIPNSVTSIGGFAFYNCSSLTSITIPNSVISIGEYAFIYCYGLTSVHITDLAAWCNISFGDQPLKYSHHLYLNGQEVKDLVIPNGVTKIGEKTFSGCSGLTLITIPNSVTSIGGSAFSDCSGLTSITIPNSVTSIGGSAFYNCSSLTSITIPNSVTSIGGSAFYNCCSLTSITIPNSVTSIGGSAFQNCIGLTSVTIPNSVTSIGNSAFSGCSSLTSVTLNSNSIVSASRTSDTSMKIIFGGQVKKYVIGDTVESIGNYAFKGCSGLTSVTILNKVTNISEKAFDNNALLFVHEGTPTLLCLWSHSDKKYNIHEIETNIDISTWYSYTASSVRVCNFEPVSGYTKKEESLKVNDAIITGNVATGLNPGVSFSYWKISLQSEAGKTYTYTLTPDNNNKTIPNLNLTTQQPKVISVGNVIVAAESNLDDEETNVGFEWRRTDWSDEFASNTGTAYLYEGTMEGYIRNLYTEKLWKYRPYYESDSGNRYYGEWVGIDPTNTNYFEPTVHTYAQINVTGNRAEVKGYVMRGTDRVTSQGFMYWKNSSSYSLRKKAAHVPAGATIVEATGNVMNAVFEDLDYETEYCYVAFVKTEENEMFYGEVQTFSTNVDPDGIDDVKAAEKAIEVARYDLNGRKLAAPQKGINIIRYSDGTSRKVLVK